MRGWLLPLSSALLVAACGSQNESQKKPQEPAAEAEPAAETEAAGPAEAEDEPSRDELVKKALARVPEIQKGVAELRGLEFKEPVPAEYQGAEDFRAFVKREIERELPAAKNDKLGRALHHVGLLKEEMDLAQVLEDAMVSQAGAYYDPAQEKFFLVMVTNNDLTLDTISSHELTHALQDQHFDLNKYYYGHEGDGPPKYSEDELNARRFIVEGEATFVMVAYSAKAMANVNMLEKPHVSNLRTQLNMFANMDIEQLVNMTKQQAGQLDLGEDFERSVEALDSIPLYVLVPLLESYMKGVMPVYEVYLAGGWDAVNALYEDPPQSTEQVLHPADKLVGERDYPVSLTVRAPAGWDELHSEVLGELGWRVYFMLWEADDPAAASAGWDGDRLAVYARGDDTVGLIATTWDSADDAEEFEAAYRTSLTKRFSDSEPPVQIRRKGADVFIVDGSKDAKLLKQLAKAKKKKHKKDR